MRASFGTLLIACLAVSACQFVARLDEPLFSPDAGAAGDGAPGSGASAAYAKAVLEDRPRVYYRFDEPSGTVAVDSSGNRNDGTLVGAARFGAAGALADGTGKAVQLADPSAAVTLPSGIDLAGNVPYTLELWVFVEPGENDGTLFEKSEGSGMVREATLAFFAPPGSTVTLGFERWHQPELVAASHQQSLIIAKGAYTHFAVTCDAVKPPRMYVNGVGYDGFIRRAGVGPAPVKNPAKFGGRFKGRLDEAALYDYALPEARILSHFRIGKPSG